MLKEVNIIDESGTRETKQNLILVNIEDKNIYLNKDKAFDLALNILMQLRLSDECQDSKG